MLLLVAEACSIVVMGVQVLLTVIAGVVAAARFALTGSITGAKMREAYRAP